MDERNQAAQYDLLVIGGGINGCGIARDAAGRGFSVLLAEMNDLASGTSSAATKLVHGGLRYLEHYEFRLVRESLLERETLWKSAPHIIWPLRFVLPHLPGLRPAWLLRLGLFVYDHLGGRKLLPPTRTLNLRRDEAGKPLKPEFGRAFEYSDCWVDDSRLVVLTARDAAARGAQIRTRLRCMSARREDGLWHISLHDGATGEIREVTARMLVNAAGPWVAEVLQQAIGQNASAAVRLVKGSHIVVPRLYEHERCYIFQNGDGRIIFSIPYERDFTLIGTTDIDYEGDPGVVAASPQEIEYLCSAASEYFAKPVNPDQVVWSYSGVRPLYDDGAGSAQETTRDYVLRLQDEDGQPALLNIFGGKITTFRRLAESAMKMVESVLGKRGPAWTADAKLPGGDFPVSGFATLYRDLAKQYAFLAPDHVYRLARAYGTDTRNVLAGVTNIAGLGRHFGGTLYEAEVRYLMETEWARTAADVLWRRSKLGLRLNREEAEALERWMSQTHELPSLKAARL
ncbi:MULTISPECIES: glycerol-3-phosphate dehydrogenase [Rhodomicrobium]|uniref:glycerol-3-phosphate dehydrogenase n=1 Tax=Rhodomicrobium TaxID=1068 RepID=UPI000B4C0C72|nr:MULTISPECIES: glycerol-3-phosphate dehydrogenase [Rhodomicrobium]